MDQIEKVKVKLQFVFSEETKLVISLTFLVKHCISCFFCGFLFCFGLVWFFFVVLDLSGFFFFFFVCLGALFCFVLIFKERRKIAKVLQQNYQLS